MIKTKCLCEKCNNEISSQIENAIENYEPGHIQCYHCKKIQKRYLSESDILLYFIMVSIYYCLNISLFLFIYDTFGINIIVILFICVLFIVSYFLLKQITHFIYEKAPFKKDIKDYEIKKDKALITKRMRWQFILFMMVAITMSENNKLYLFILIAFIIINAIKLYFSIKNEYKLIFKK